MKRILFAAIIFLVIISAFPVSAAADVVFMLESTESVKTGRLFDVKILASSGSNASLGAAIFEFGYDEAKVQFKKASASNGSDVTANDTGGKVRIVYLCSDGKMLNSSAAEVITLQFKALSGSDDQGFRLSCEECCSAAAVDLSTAITGGLTVIITGSTVNPDRNASQADSSSKNNATSKAAEKSTGSTVQTDNEEANDPQNDANNHSEHSIFREDNSFFAFAAGIGITLLLVVVFLSAYMLGAKKRRGFEKNKKL